MEKAQNWKTEEYHGYDMHVCSTARTAENEELAGHGAQWDFVLKVTLHGEDPSDSEETARSDNDTYYSTQSIAENMGFLKGREVIDGLAGRRDGLSDQNSRAL